MLYSAQHMSLYKSNWENNSDVVWEPSFNNDDNNGDIEGCNEKIAARETRREIIRNLV